MFAGTQQAASDKPKIKPIRTDSPRATLTSFLLLRDELEETLQTYRSNKSRELAEKVQVLARHFRPTEDFVSPEHFRQWLLRKNLPSFIEYYLLNPYLGDDENAIL